MNTGCIASAINGINDDIADALVIFFADFLKMYSFVNQL